MNTKYMNKVLGGMTACLLFFGACFFTSCDDYLDVTPSDKQTAAQVFASKEGFYTAANGIYDALASDELYGKQMTWEAMDLMAPSYVTTYSMQYMKSLAANNYSDAYSAPILSSIWKKAYEVILNANLLIDQVDQQQGKLTTVEANCLKGEMLAVRAFLHLDMLRLFGPVPQLGLDKPAIPYNNSSDVFVHDLLTVKEAAEKIIEDLNAAEELLKNDPIIENGPMMSPAQGTESVQLRYRQYRMNYYAVIALKARAYNWVCDAGNAMAQAKRLIDDPKVQQMFPPVDPNKLLANSSNPDRVFSSEVFMGVYDKDRDQVYNLYFASTAPVSQRLQPLSTYVTGNLGLFNHILLGSETSDYRFQSQWEMASGLGATGYSFIKFKPIDRPDPLDENSEYYYAKMIPLITMQEMYYIMLESSSTDMEKYSWYNKARVRRGLPDLDAMGMGDTFAMYWGYGYGGYFYDQEVRRETWGLGQYFFYAKHNQFYGDYGSYTPMGSGSGNSNPISIQPPLPAEEMK
ncbi:MAG: RagB/SusD family nutrient uptake outer membrane protein [Prevotella sp.]|nr:RagB/SusD family nutrient uptake outer membrane protein [Prevotella sp.]MBQ6031716.1 RagB/SusD family nutrient uptake outer membrane protein [Prevotella sp.]